jgi:hypothetical protein
MTGLLPPGIFLQQLTQALVGQRFDSMMPKLFFSTVLYLQGSDPQMVRQLPDWLGSWK